MRRALVNKALNRDNPSRIPMVYFNGRLEDSDIILIEVIDHHIMTPDGDTSEWGFTWAHQDDGTMGQVSAPFITDGVKVSSVPVPDPFDPQRYEVIEEYMKKYGTDRFYIASLGLSGFTIMTLLRGFTQTLVDIMLKNEEISELADIIFHFEMDLIRQLPKYGYDGIAFFDDWGMQQTMIISPKLWREFFLPRYKEEFSLAHEIGLKVYFHSCGYIEPIIENLIEAGVDFLNLSQPNLYDLKEVGRKFAGRVCFVEPVSYQTTSLSGDKQAIWKDVEDVIEYLGANGHGVIGYLERYESIGLSNENYLECEKAFRTLGSYDQVNKTQSLP